MHSLLFAKNIFKLILNISYLKKLLHLDCDRLLPPHYSRQEFRSTLPVRVWISAHSGHGFSFPPSEWSECTLVNLHCLTQTYGCLFRSESTGFVTRHRIYNLCLGFNIGVCVDLMSIRHLRYSSQHGLAVKTKKLLAICRVRWINKVNITMPISTPSQVHHASYKSPNSVRLFSWTKWVNIQTHMLLPRRVKA